jgi:hypothetical protein
MVAVERDEPAETQKGEKPADETTGKSVNPDAAISEQPEQPKRRHRWI